MRQGAAPGTAAPVLEQAFDEESLYQLRAAVAAHAIQAGLPNGRADDLVVSIHELATNAIRHGAGHGVLRMWADGQAVRCQVTDDGPRSGAGTARSAQAPADAAPWPVEPTHGLWLVVRLADECTVRSGPRGTVVTIALR